MFSLKSGEEIIKKTKPHPAAFLSSLMFWVGLTIFFLGIVEESVVTCVSIRFLLIGIGFSLMGVGYLRRVVAYTFYFTDKRIVSNYAFLRNLHREISYDKIIDVMVKQGVFGKICGYADVWMYGYSDQWIVGRMRGVSLGDSRIIENRAWKNKHQHNK